PTARSRRGVPPSWPSHHELRRSRGRGRGAAFDRPTARAAATFVIVYLAPNSHTAAAYQATVGLWRVPRSQVRLSCSRLHGRHAIVAITCVSPDRKPEARRLIGQQERREFVAHRDDD